MHDDELEIDEPLVRRLLTDQFPEWAGLPLRRVEPAGTDNAIFRLGEDRMVRLARRKGSTRLGGKESDWLPRLAPLVPLEIPVPLAQGRPTGEYPWFWDVFTWVEGTPTSFGDRRAYAEWKEQLGRLRDTLAHDGSLLDEERDPVRAIELFDSVRRFAERIWAAPDSSEELA